MTAQTARIKLKDSDRITAAPSAAVSITAESDALAGAVATWLNVQPWNAEYPRPGFNPGDQSIWGAFPEMELKIEGDATETITAPQLYSCELSPVTIADQTFTASGATLTVATASPLDGDGPFRVSNSGGALPAGLLVDTAYYVEYLGATTVSLHTSRSGAIAKSAATLITTTDAGTGTHTLEDLQSEANPDDNTRRFHTILVGDLNEAAAIIVGAQIGYKERIKHSPLSLYYFVTATVGVAQTLVITLTPVIESEE